MQLFFVCYLFRFTSESLIFQLKIVMEQFYLLMEINTMGVIAIYFAIINFHLQQRGKVILFCNQVHNLFSNRRNIQSFGIQSPIYFLLKPIKQCHYLNTANKKGCCCKVRGCFLGPESQQVVGSKTNIVHLIASTSKYVTLGGSSTLNKISYCFRL